MKVYTKVRVSLSRESIAFLKREFVRLHRVMMEGQDAVTKLGAIASLFNAEGIALPKTNPPVVIAKEVKKSKPKKRKAKAWRLRQDNQGAASDAVRDQAFRELHGYDL